MRETYLVLIVFNRGASHNDDPLLPDALAKLARWCSQMTCGADGTVRFYEQSGFGEGVVLSPSQHRSAWSAENPGDLPNFESTVVKVRGNSGDGVVCTHMRVLKWEKTKVAEKRERRERRTGRRVHVDRDLEIAQLHTNEEAGAEAVPEVVDGGCKPPVVEDDGGAGENVGVAVVGCG